MKTYTLQAAAAQARKHGFTFGWFRDEDTKANRMVTLHQNWSPKGVECAEFRLALGKYRGQEIARLYRSKPY